MYQYLHLFVSHEQLLVNISTYYILKNVSWPLKLILIVALSMMPWISAVNAKYTKYKNMNLILFKIQLLYIECCWRYYVLFLCVFLFYISGVYQNAHKIMVRDKYITIFISHPISTRDTHISKRTEGQRANMGVSARYGVWYEHWHIIIYVSYTSNSINKHKHD